MKKICCFLLVSFLLYGMAGCTQSNRTPALSEINDVDVESFGSSSVSQQDDIPSQKTQCSVTHISSDNIFELSTEDSEMIAQMLDAANWISDSTKCDSDYTFILGDRTIYYHSDCGTFNEKTNQEHLSLSLSDAEKEVVNSILQAAADNNQ